MSGTEIIKDTLVSLYAKGDITLDDFKSMPATLEGFDLNEATIEASVFKEFENIVSRFDNFTISNKFKDLDGQYFVDIRVESIAFYFHDSLLDMRKALYEVAFKYGVLIKLSCLVQQTINPKVGRK